MFYVNLRLLWLLLMILMLEKVTRYVKRKRALVCAPTCVFADTIIPCYFMAFHFFRRVKATPCLCDVTER